LTLPLSPQVFTIMSKLIEDATGLHYEMNEAHLLADRLSTRAAELELESLLDYYYYLRYDEAGPRELDTLVELLLVHETYFFREVDQLVALVDTLVPRLLETYPVVRIWSAACATGEEPLTLAMLLKQRGLLGRVKILASDLSAPALAKARAGIFRGRSLRVLEPADGERYFVTINEGSGGIGSGRTLRVRDEIAAAVDWTRLNLFDEERMRAMGEFEIILCRNALIYFRDEMVLNLIERFAERLPVGGLLLVGASESLLRFGTAFDCEEHGGAFFYRKRAS
jgi:chemotaxis protein methyltransferase CheR